MRLRRESGLILFWLAIIALFALASPQFLSLDSLRAITNASYIELTVAGGMAAIIISGRIDLSVGSVVGVAAYAAGAALSGGVDPIVAAALAVVAGLACGAINGVLVAVLKVPAIIATLGSATFFRGALFIAAPQLAGTMISASQLPADFRALSAQAIFGLPIAGVTALAVTALVAGFMAWNPWGRDMYSIGSNPDQAREVGIRVDRSVFASFVLLGALAGLAGFLYLMRFASVDVRTGTGLEFTVIAAVVVGGVAVAGGSGTVVGAALGVLVLNTLSRGFVLMSIPEFWKVVGTGVAIIAAAAFDTAILRRHDQLLRSRRRRFTPRSGGGGE